MSREIASKLLKPVDVISYAYFDRIGIVNETQFVFDLKLPSDFTPFNTDGEVECFYLMNIEQVSNSFLNKEIRILTKS